MSKEALIAFDNRLHYDTALQNQIRTLRRVDAEGLIRIGAEAGFNFTMTELIEMIYASQETELSNDQLDLVAGGVQASLLPGPGSLSTIQQLLFAGGTD